LIPWCLLCALNLSVRFHDNVRTKLFILPIKVADVDSGVTVADQLADPPGCPVLDLNYSLADQPSGAWLVGAFSLPDGRTAALLQNQDDRLTSWPTVTFATTAATTTANTTAKLSSGGEDAGVLEVSPTSGQEGPVLDDSPAMSGLQVRIESGGARLFILE
jgi:hypothetical protein